MLPSIGSVSALAGQGQVGVVVSARPIGEEEGGRQLVALRIREGELAREARTNGAATAAGSAGAGDRGHGNAVQVDLSSAARNPGSAPAGEASGGAQAERGASAARLPNELSASEKAAVSKLQQRDQQVRQERRSPRRRGRRPGGAHQLHLPDRT